jgi:hypothetical protein
MEITKETVNDLWNGHTVVGTTRVKVVNLALGTKALKGILLVTPGSNAPTPNTNPIWIGGGGVTADSALGTGGLWLMPGDRLFIPIADLSKLYAVSTAVDQDLAWMGM